jgi:hypothetical protein
VWTKKLDIGGLIVSAEGPLDWPASSEQLVAESQGRLLLTLPPVVPANYIGKKVWWWHGLFASPAGYLPPDTRFEYVTVGYPAREYLWFGPRWARTWLFASMCCVTAGAVVTAGIVKVKQSADLISG